MSKRRGATLAEKAMRSLVLLAALGAIVSASFTAARAQYYYPHYYPPPPPPEEDYGPPPGYYQGPPPGYYDRPCPPGFTVQGGECRAYRGY